jgi:hypothetical protein
MTLTPQQEAALRATCEAASAFFGSLDQWLTTLADGKVPSASELVTARKNTATLRDAFQVVEHMLKGDVERSVHWGKSMAKHRPLDRPIAQPNAPMLSREIRPEQKLAAAVIGLAVADLRDWPTIPRERAAAFLFNPTSELRFWCAVAGLDSEVVRRRARQVAGDRVSRHRSSWIG